MFFASGRRFLRGVNMLPKIDFQALLSSKTESAFWTAFEAAHLQVSAWPNAMLVLWTPTAPYLALFGANFHDREIMELDGEMLTSRPIGPIRLGNIRRDVRRGNWAVSLRDTQRQWHMIHDHRGLPGAFTDPMLPSTDLGLARQSAPFQPYGLQPEIAR
jgi:hypothetical protein